MKVFLKIKKPETIQGIKKLIEYVSLVSRIVIDKNSL